MLRLITAAFIAAGLFPAAHGKNDLLIYHAASFSHYFPQKSVDVVKSAYKKSSLSFLVLHDDENTGVEAAHDFCAINGGSITELKYGNERNISFGSKNVRFSFDPNQIFNNAGVLKTLKKYSISRPSVATVNKIRSLAFSLLNAYNPDSLGYIITLHNNTDGRFSIASYAQDKLLKGIADSIYINPEMDQDDFVLVTEPAFFNYLKSKSVSSILQSESARDGSLSVYAQMNKIPYINIEVQDGHREEHLRLIQVVDNMLKDIGGQQQQLYAGEP
ncbi:MAG TPA: hypothetical protein VKB19_12110 [Pedobacter sp.]|nr:hypothetical protein [Pedobacter sp.]